MALPLAFPYSKFFSDFTPGGRGKRRCGCFGLGWARPSVRLKPVTNMMDTRFAFIRRTISSRGRLTQSEVVKLPSKRLAHKTSLLPARTQPTGNMPQGRLGWLGRRLRITAQTLCPAVRAVRAAVL